MFTWLPVFLPHRQGVRIMANLLLSDVLLNALDKLCASLYEGKRKSVTIECKVE